MQYNQVISVKKRFLLALEHQAAIIFQNARLLRSQWNVSMRKRLYTLFAALVLSTCCLAIEQDAARAFIGEDLSLAGAKVTSWQGEDGGNVLLFEDGFELDFSGSGVRSDKAVLWLKRVSTEVRGRVRYDYAAKIYLEGKVSIAEPRGGAMVFQVEESDAGKVVRFDVSGDVYVTVDERVVSQSLDSVFYRRAALAAVDKGPRFVVQRDAVVPAWRQTVKAGGAGGATFGSEADEFGDGLFGSKGEKTKVEKYIESTVVSVKKPEKGLAGAVIYRYPVRILPAGDEPLSLESGKSSSGETIATIRQRFYISRKRDEKGNMLELQADAAVIYYDLNGAKEGEKGQIKAVYVTGDVTLTEGTRTIRCEEMYYDFANDRALAVNGEMRTFDTKRNMPVYVRSEKIKRLAEHKFYAEKVTITSSEFHKPQVSAEVGQILVVDRTDIEEIGDDDSRYEARMKDFRLKYGERTVFKWPYVRSNLERPDLPIKSLSVGNDRSYGTSVESQWYLSRLLGLAEPEGVDSTLALDYYSKRGFGAGVAVEYERDNYYGRVVSYIIRDHGEDRLGRAAARRNIDAGNDMRGRFGWLHRQFLPNKWQLTAGLNYVSDENFLEQYYREEFSEGIKPETYLHLKRIDENRGLSILGLVRINDYSDELEQIPTVEYHVAGESVFDDEFTLYSDTQVSRLRQRIGDRHTTQIDEDDFTFISQRTELDLPIQGERFKFVPYTAANFGFDDRSGFRRSRVNGQNAGNYGSSAVGIGEVGVRIFDRSWWKLYPNVKSRLWDINKLRHVMTPYMTAAVYYETDSVVDQKDVIQLGLTQRLQTKRGQGKDRRTVDWMRLDSEFVFVDDSESAGTTGPDRFMWNRPMVPMRVMSSPEIFNGDFVPNLRRFEMWGPRRNYFASDYIWRVSDTSAVMSDIYFDLQSSVVTQYNIGYSRLVWPDLSYYIGSRYLRRTQILNEKGTNAVVFAATYRLDPRYTMVFSQQFDFDYGANVRSDITLIRRYHRMFMSLTYSADASLKEQAVVIGIWPQGVSELSLGERRFAGIGGWGTYQ